MSNEGGGRTITYTGAAAMALINGALGVQILVIVGLIWLIVVGAFLWVSSRAAYYALRPIASRWPAPRFGHADFRRPLLFSLLGFTGVTLLVDLVLPGSISFPGMLRELDRTLCDGATGCTQYALKHPLVDTLGAYYALNVGTGLLAWPIYLLKLVPGSLMFAIMFRTLVQEPNSGYWFSGPGGRRRLAFATLVAVGLTTAVVFPLFTWLLILGRNGS